MALNGTEREAGPGLRLGTAIVACALCAASTWFLLAAMSHAAWNGDDTFLGAALGLMAQLGLICAIAVRAWRVPVAIAVAGALLLAIGAVSGAPLTVRWRASEPAFDRWITAHSHADVDEPFRLGWFRVEQVTAGPSGLVLFYEEWGDLSDTGDGIAYLPRGAAFTCPDNNPCDVRALGGPWYAWVGYS